MRCFFLDGAYHMARSRKLPLGAVVVPRMPAAGERWDAASGKFVLDEAAAIATALAEGHVARAHLVKSIEASLILSGFALSHGVIADEAAATGATIEDIARAVAAHDQPFRAIEASRRRARTIPAKEHRSDEV